MVVDGANPLIVQSDGTILLDVHAEKAEEARAAILPFAELEKSPEHIHTYRITPLSLWNGASAGLSAQDVVATLQRYSRYPISSQSLSFYQDLMGRYGKLRLKRAENTVFLPPDTLLLTCDDGALWTELAASRSLAKYLHPLPERQAFSLSAFHRGVVKQECIRLLWPVCDEAPLTEGAPLELSLRKISRSGKPFAPREYQFEAARSVLGNGKPGSGYGVVVLPCGAGKTIVGMVVMAQLKTNTLILTTNVAAVHQWIDELLDKTTLTEHDIAEYTGDSKQVAPVTVATYQILTWRAHKEGEFPHFALFRQRPWGLIIYDEVHLLPAPVFRVTAELQAVRRLGLTATLVREDGNEDSVFSLVGPKRYDVPWKDLEQRGWIAEARCVEIRIDLPEDLRVPYTVAQGRAKYRLASENPLKMPVVMQLVANHPEDYILIIGQYISQLESLARVLKVPLITGQTPNRERERLYESFKRGEQRILVVSKVANFAIDLPDASVAIQISGSFGSRQEEAQRLGRILRPKQRNAYFYSLVSRYTVEEEYATHRQQFLTEQGYRYSIQYWSEEELSYLGDTTFSPFLGQTKGSDLKGATGSHASLLTHEASHG
ncbi:MAG: DEAD/DEAH box helicase [Treponemataceae bacterium]|nr:DEAD/DEAH box helicase [Treponemataceae bacterium]